MIAGQIAPLYLFIRIAAAIGGALVGYFLSGPAMRLLFRLAFQKPVPGWLLPLGKIGGGALVGVLIFFFLPLGGGDGWGWGPGGGAGAGLGDGSGQTAHDKGKTIKPKGDEPKLEQLDIELLGGAKVQGDGRYYLVNREMPAKTLDEIKTMLEVKLEALIQGKDQTAKLKVSVIVTDESVADTHPAVIRLHDVIRNYKKDERFKDKLD